MRSLPDDADHPHCAELLEVDAAHRAEVERLTGLLEECNAVCLCGCPAGEHESYGEDGESCGHDDHECIRVAPAVLAHVEALRKFLLPLDAGREVEENARRVLFAAELHPRHLTEMEGDMIVALTDLLAALDTRSRRG